MENGLPKKRQNGYYSNCWKSWYIFTNRKRRGLLSYTGTCVYQTYSGLMIKSIWLILVVPAISTVKRNRRQAGRRRTDMKMSNRRPGTRTYALLRKEVSPRSDLFGAGVVGLDLFTNWIEDEALFQRPWQEILPASDTFKALIRDLAESGSTIYICRGRFETFPRHRIIVRKDPTLCVILQKI